MMKFQQQFSQQQKQTQKLAMTQKLQQSIQVLQFSADELLSFIDNQALENPLIDLGEYDSPITLSKSSGSSEQIMDYLSQIPDQHTSLFEHLIDQVHLNYRDTFLRTIVLFLVEYIDLNGFLTIDLEEAGKLVGGTPIQMLDALTLIQQLDPAGVGARDLRECLMLQTERDDYAPPMAYLILEEFFTEMAERKWDKISKALQIPLTEIQKVFDYVQTLTPTPGAAFGSTDGLYIVPDLRVTVEKGQPIVKSNKRALPEVRFQQQYFDQLKQSGDPEVLSYLDNKAQEFEWLKKTLLQRGDTIYRVGVQIVARQKEFFTQPDRPLKPLVLREVAEELGIHESTVSRAVNGKYLETSFGVFELKLFFGQKVSTQESGDDLTTASIKQQLKALIDEENKNKPLSDQKLTDALKAQGIDISRRTVAKYREAMNIPGSSKRKRFE
ncbi:RNA polymerase sigma-54 factor [Enterococcus casseliflavus ATCC 12755]|uniref:RNA polymerase sigma-54 factor n=1 Tax=Enterococcus casseliflavus ATCC 12755 TaxID=888066 RepID=F0EJ74_ENTCA|nr:MULTISPECIES: RNA polymerase factor sigma-54 [Enterococcus]EGC70124.1 RNA polymerase sigma-54 factor [Enterococcus casseliflavus ATCC 12755]